jgi:hypothetical protein
MALEWLGDLARKINSVVTTPSQQATQLAGQYSEDNPWRTRIGLMTGTPSVDVLQQASNWDINNRNTRLAEDQFAAQTVNVNPEMLQRFQEYSPDNLNAHMLTGGTRYLNDVAAINQREEALRQQAKVKAAQASILSGMQPYMQQLQSTPQGSLTLNALQNSDAFTPEQWSTTYGQTPGIIQGGINRAAQEKALGGVVGAMQNGATKQMLQQLLPLVNLDGMEGMGTQIAGSALGSVPKPLTPMDQAEIAWRNSEAWRNYNVLPENSGGGISMFGNLGFGNNKQAQNFIKNINDAYNLEMKKNGGRLTTDPVKGEVWVFPNGKPTPPIGSWVSSKYGEEAYRKYMALMTGNADFADNSRTLFGITNPGVIQNDWDLKADQYLRQSGLGSLTKTIDRVIADPNVDPQLVASLLRRYKSVFKKDYQYNIQSKQAPKKKATKK